MNSPLVNFQNYNVADVKYSHLLLESNAKYHVNDRRQINRLFELHINSGWTVFYQSRAGDTEFTLIYKYRSMLIKYYSAKRWTFIDVAGDDEIQVQEYLGLLLRKLPKLPEASEGLVNVRFWNTTPTGSIQNYAKRLEVPRWENIGINYNAETRDGLNSLMNFVPKHGGQLILWHGLPGAGKTYALRALLEAWKSWATAEYIVDPELLFGSANYLISLLLHGETQTSMYDPDDEDDSDIASLEVKEGGKWKLLIMEDTGELLTENAKDRTGQGLSRLLNVADGFIGQGLRTLILITTNELLEKFHPAVSRPGRCAASIEFNPLDRYEAELWAKENDVKKLPKQSSYTLAELYGLSDKILGNSIKPLNNPIGFGAPLA